MIKNLTIFDKYTEKENNATKALIDLLRHSEVQLTELFITRCLGISQLNHDLCMRNYDIQVGTQLLLKSGIGCVIAICDESVNDETHRVNSIKEKDTIPDALISFNNVTLLIEAKVDGSKIDTQQFKDHEKKFARDEIINPPIYVSWQKIHAFFEELLLDTNHSWGELTLFLLQQYLAFCEHMGFTYVKNESYIYTFFTNRPRVLNVISEIHEYLTRYSDVHFNKPITDCFGYTIVKARMGEQVYKTHKFFTSTLFNKGTYVLHLLSSEQAKGLQQQVDAQFKGNQKKNKNAPKEVHINMDLVDNFTQIKPYIDIAYQDRKQLVRPLS